MQLLLVRTDIPGSVVFTGGKQLGGKVGVLYVKSGSKFQIATVTSSAVFFHLEN